MTHARTRTLVIVAALASGSCVSPRTQIVARFDTDMTQGPTGNLTGVRVRVISQDEVDPRFDQRFDLGVGTDPLLLPSELGIVPRDTSNRRVTVEADALSGDSVLFTRRAIATFATGRTLLLDVFLPDRCRFPENRMCPEGFTCGATGCEPIEQPELPEFRRDGGGLDAGTDAAPRDSGQRDSGPPDSGPTDAGEDGGDAGCASMCAGACVDLMTDIAHCGACDSPCTPPANATATCVAGGCGFTCDVGFNACGGSGCVADDPTVCGAACAVCPPPPANASATCEAGACAIACDPGFLEVDGRCLSTAAPRPLAPLSMGRTSTTRPTFVWELPALADGARVEVCNDPACATVALTFDGTGTSATAPVVLPGTRFVYYFRLFAMRAGEADTLPSPTWAFIVPVRDEVALAPTSWPLLFDVELDGIGDIAVGAPGDASVRVIPGRAGGPAPAEAVELRGVAGSAFGASIAGAGDVNGDGRSDLIVGAPNAAQAHLYLGSPSGLGPTATVLTGPASFGSSVAPAGDVDGDGYADVIVAAPGANQVFLFRGSATGILTTPAATLSGAAGSRFGASIAGGGDVNGDLFSDVVVGAPDAASAFVYLGSASGLVTTAATTLTGAAGSRFGASVAIAGDTVDADGLCDVVVGAPGTRTVTIYTGALAGLGTTASYSLTQTNAEFGLVVAYGGDLDQNAFDEVMVGSATNVVWQYLSNRSGPGARAGWTLSITAPAGAMGFGLAMAAGGYATNDRDLFGDLVIGAPGSNTAYYWNGASAGVTGAPALTLSGAAGSGFGTSVE